MDDGIDVIDQRIGGALVVELTGKPIDRCGKIVETVTVAVGSVPATTTVSGSGQSLDDVATQKTGGTGHSDVHDVGSPRMYSRAIGRFVRVVAS